jgi:hypothetical protein
MKSTVPSVNPRITVKESKVDNILNYDIDNKYPSRIDDIIKASGTASNCSEKYAKFINGKGFKDNSFYKSKINRRQLTVDGLLRQTTADYSKFRGFAIHVNYNALLQVNEVNYIPFENCRLGLRNSSGYVSKIAVYDNWDLKNGTLDKSKIDFIDRWNPGPEVIMAQINAAGGIQNYKGQVLWYSADGDDKYPLSIVDPVLEDVVSDAGMKTFRLRSVSTSFLPSHTVEYPFEFESEEDEQQEVENWKKFQGPENANKIMILQNKSGPDNSIKINKVELQDTDKMYNITNTTCKNSIIERYGIPPVLANVLIPGKLGTATEFEDAYKIYNSVTSDERKLFEEKFKEVFSIYRNPINVSGDYSIIPLSFDVASL